MVKLSQTNLNKIFEGRYRIYLLYGPNTGLINNISDRIVNCLISSKNHFNYNIIDEIKSEEELINEIYRSSLIKSKYVIIIKTEDINQKYIKILEKFITSKNEDNIIIFKSAELSPSANLRKFCEKNNNTISLSLFNSIISSQEIRDLGKVYNINFTNSAINMLSRILGEDDYQKHCFNVEKLCCYFSYKNKFEVTEAELFEITETYIDEKLKNQILLEYILEKNLISFEEAIYNYENIIIILRHISRYIHILLEIKENIENGSNMMVAVAEITPPIFFKEKDILIKLANKYSMKEIKNLLYKINNIEILSKSNGWDDKFMIRYLFFNC